MAVVSRLPSALRLERQPTRPYVHPSQYRAPENVRLYSDGMHKLYQPSLITLAIAVVTLGLYVGVPHILLALLAFSWWRPAAITLVLLLLSLLLPAQPLRVNSVLSSYVFLCWRRYFHFSYLFERSLDCYQDYIIAQFPHGAFPLGALLGGTFMATEYPEYTCYATAASSAFYVPIWRHVHAWLGTEVCTKANFHNLLSRGVMGPQRNSTSTSRASGEHHQRQEQQQQLQLQLSSSTDASRHTPFKSAQAAGAAAECTAGSASACCEPQLRGKSSPQQLLHPRHHISSSFSASIGSSLSASIRARFSRQPSLSDTESSDSEAEARQRLMRQRSNSSDAASTPDSCCSSCSLSPCGSQQQQLPRGWGHSRATVPPAFLSTSSGSQRLPAAPEPAGAADALPPPPGAQQSAGCSWEVDAATGQRKTGVSVGLMVGGIAEMFMIRPDHERIKLKDRKGFVRVAVERGVPILPVYMFGANQVLDFGPPWLQRFSRRMRASVGMIYGAWGLPVPRRLPIFMVTGAPMDVGPPLRKDHPDFAARVDEVHAKFVGEMQRIYYTHRAKYGHGFEDRPLVIC